MAPHLTHMGVHDHGFNNVSTYGTLWRLGREGRIDAEPWELRFYELALKASGAVQARRWTPLPGGGYIHSFNGAHSLFVDTIRSLRSLAIGHLLGQRLLEEQDAAVDLLERLVQHARATAQYNVYFGTGRDRFDVRGRVAHESLFNVANGTYRGPSTQQGYSPFSTWTRGLAWAMLGFAEEIEFLETVPDAALDAVRRTRRDRRVHARCRARDVRRLHRRWPPPTACPTGTPARPGSRRSATWGDRPSDPFNDHEPVDSSAAAIGAQGLLRLAARPRAARRSRCGPLLAGRAARRLHADRSVGPVRQHRPGASGPAAALGVSLAERMGLRAAGRDDAARRVEPMGRLSPARGGALRASGSPKARRTSPSSGRRSTGPNHGRRAMNARTALVTGGTRGIGLGIAQALAAEGWRLILVGDAPDR